MKSKDKIALEKMVAYAKELESYITGMDYDAFSADSKTINACAFLIGQLGELTTVISSEAQSMYTEIPWRNIKGMRNRIIHDYDNVDFIVLWKTVSESIPQLQNTIQTALDKTSQEE